MIAVRFDVDKAVADLTDVEKRQVPFAFALAANRTVSQAHREVRNMIPIRLAIRKSSTLSEMRKAVVFGEKQYANSKTGKLSAELLIVGDPAAGKDVKAVVGRLGAILIRQEEGGVRVGRRRVLIQPRGLQPTVRQLTRNRGKVLQGLQESYAGHLIPFEGLRSKTKAMSRALYPINIGLEPRWAIGGGEELASQYKGGKKKSGKGYMKNTRFYFATPKGIFVRNQLSSGKSEVDGVWWFRPRITLRPRLGFASTFEEIARKDFGPNFIRAMGVALRTAKR